MADSNRAEQGENHIPDISGIYEFNNRIKREIMLLKNTYVCLSKEVEELEEEVRTLKIAVDDVQICTSDAFSKEISEKLFECVVNAAQCDEHERIKMLEKKNSVKLFGTSILKAQCDELHEGMKMVEQQLVELKANTNLAKQKAVRSSILAKLTMLVDWGVKGHGQYLYITKENEFFSAKDRNYYFVVHCSSESSVHCKRVDMHLSAIAAEHIETKFVKFDVEKIPSLSNHLNIQVTPTVLCFIKSEGVDVIVDHDELGVGDELSAERLEQRLANSGVINYDLFPSLEI